MRKLPCVWGGVLDAGMRRGLSEFSIQNSEGRIGFGSGSRIQYRIRLHDFFKTVTMLLAGNIGGKSLKDYVPSNPPAHAPVTVD